MTKHSEFELVHSMERKYRNHKDLRGGCNRNQLLPLPGDTPYRNCRLTLIMMCLLVCLRVAGVSIYPESLSQKSSALALTKHRAAGSKFKGASTEPPLRDHHVKACAADDDDDAGE